MCGICGVINFKQEPVNPLVIKNMQESIRHRGPNDEGAFLEDNLGLGFVRLSIIDLTAAGHQPMFSDDGRYVIVFNGEIFNYIELRKTLELEGVQFKTNSDTEVLLKSYIHWGPECQHKFNGMWAFVIYDRVQKKIFGSRDRYGIKPFYYYYSKNRFVFASELPAILTALDKKIDANELAIYDYLTYNRTDHTEETFFENVFKIQHGSCFTIIDSKLNIDRWYSLKTNVSEPFTSTEEYHDLFNDSIGLRLRSDVPVGVCLSGGLDSSSITAVMAKEFNMANLHTFSAVYGKGEKGDESVYIHEFANMIQNLHFVYPNGTTLFNDVDDFIFAHGEPVPTTSPYAQFKVMELASKYVVVTLDGQGADEQLGGYHNFFGYYLKGLLAQGELLTIMKELYYCFILHPNSEAAMSFLYYLLPPDMKEKIRLKSRGFINPDFIKKYNKEFRIPTTLESSKNLNEAFINHFESKLEHLLKWEDRNSMHFSLEARVPFLDHRLVEKTISLNPEKILRNGRTKMILREAMSGIVPESILSRKDKIGFGTPEGNWFRNDPMKNIFIELFDSKKSRIREYISVDIMRKKYQMHLAGKTDISSELWKCLHLERWLNRFVD